MAGTQTQENEKGQKGIHTFYGDYYDWWLGGDTPRRRYFTLHITFGEARKTFEIMPFDPETGKGEQRQRIDSHVRTLTREMLAGNYTPTPWSGGLRDNHLKKLEIDEKKKKYSITVSERSPLSLTDGGHRYRTLDEMRNKALEAGDKEKIAIIDALPVTIQVMTEPEWLDTDFLNYQAGKQVSRSQLKFMREQMAKKKGVAPEDKKTPIDLMAHTVAWTLNLPETESFLSNDVNFLGGGGGLVDYSAISGKGSSDSGTSLTGGAKIASYEGFKSLLPTEEDAVNFLVACYKAIYDGIMTYDDKAEWVDPVLGKKQKFPQLLMPGRMLRPNKLGGRGPDKATKGGTGLLIMLGNMLAFWMLAVRKKVEIPIPAADIKHIVKSAQEVLDAPVRGGGSGPWKREITGQFARVYFHDVVRHGEDDEHDLKKLGAVDGIPTLLCDYILTRSTLDVPTNAAEFIPADKVDEDEGREKRMSDPDQTDTEWTEEDEASPIGQVDTGEPQQFEPPPPSKRGRKKKDATEVMG